MFTSRVISSKVIGWQILPSPLCRFCHPPWQILPPLISLKVEGEIVRGLLAILSEAVADRNQASLLQSRNLILNRSLRHFADLRKAREARKAPPGLSVVVIRQPIKHNLGGRFQPPLLHRQRRHVMAHGLSFRVVETPAAMLYCGQRIRQCVLPIPAAYLSAAAFLGRVERLPVLPAPIFYRSYWLSPSRIFAASLKRYHPLRRITSPSSSIWCSISWTSRCGSPSSWAIISALADGMIRR